MGKKEDLERQLAEVKAATERVIIKLDECMNKSEKQKATSYDQIIPLARHAIETKVKSGQLDWKQFTNDLTEKLLKTVFGDTVLEDMGKI